MPQPHLYDEQLLFRKIASGDETALRILFDLYKAELYYAALKLTKSSAMAEDITQDVFIGIWVSRAHLSTVASPSSYIYKILLNKISRYLTLSNKQRILRDAMLTKEMAVNSTEELMNARDSKNLIDQAINQLPPQQKAVYQLSQQQGLSTREIAMQLNISPLTAKSYLRDATRFIRTYCREVAFVLGILCTWK